MTIICHTDTLKRLITLQNKHTECPVPIPLLQEKNCVLACVFHNSSPLSHAILGNFTFCILPFLSAFSLKLSMN